MWPTILLTYHNNVFISDSDIRSSACSLLFAPSSSSIAIVDIVLKSNVFTVFSIVLKRIFFPTLLAFFFSILCLNLSFSDIKYKVFLCLFFCLIGVISTSSTIVGVYDMPSTTPLSYILLVFVSHINLARITIIRVAIGVQWLSYINASFILFLFLVYLPNLSDIPIFHIHFVLFIMSNYLLFWPNLIVPAFTSSLHSHILKLCQLVYYLTPFSSWYPCPHFSHVIILYYTTPLWVQVSYDLVSKGDIF